MVNMKYMMYRYLYPPRPEKKIAPTDLRHVESMGWWGQAKMNGTCCTIYVTPDNGSTAMGRHGPDHKLQWQPSASWASFANSLAPGWHVFVGELLHSKVKGGPKDTVYLFDMLVENDEYLVGMSYRDRFQRLTQTLNFYNGEPYSDATHRGYNEGLWLTQPRARAFAEWYNAPRPSHVEGLVFKNPKAVLMPCSRESSNNDWQVKCRYPKANLAF